MTHSSQSTVLESLVGNVLQKHPTFDQERIQAALSVACEVYAGNTHWSNESLIDHVAGSLQDLLRFQPDEDAIISSILHHILEFDEWSVGRLEEEFGSNVRTLVSSVHLLGHVTVKGKHSSVMDLRIMLLTIADDVRALLILLTNMCHIVRRIDKIEREKQVHFCHDMLQLFAPIAARLGIYSIKHELESGVFPIIYPNDAERINEQYERVHGLYGNFLPSVMKQFGMHLQNGALQAEVRSREKQSFSIFMKMREKNLNYIEDVYDLFALRVLVDTPEQCYQALGLLHQCAQPVSHRFKDYISFPKPNGYQSLHTTVMQMPGAPDGVKLEVQIRTKQMDQEAQYGVAAHWTYKEGGPTSTALQGAQLHKILSSQEALEQEGGPQFVDHIFVLTPGGDVIELPEGATPLDFAFFVHTELGLSFKGSRINGKMVPIDYRLENGDVVEIMKHSTPRPSSQWLQLLKTSSAKAKLKRYLYSQERPQLLSLGKKYVNEQLRKRNEPILDSDLSIMKHCDGKELSYSQREDILIKIGQGSERASSLFERLALYATEERKTHKPGTKKSEPPANVKTLEVEGGLAMPTRHAKCCKPDESKQSKITGIINRQGTVMIHKQSCKMLRNANKERMLKAVWK